MQYFVYDPGVESSNLDRELHCIMSNLDVIRCI